VFSHHVVVTPGEHDDGVAELCWIDGEAWCDLTESIDAAGAATVVSQNGATVLLDLGRRRYRRMPLEGGQVLPVDSLWLPFRAFRLTACGLTIDGSYPYWGTPVRLVLEGLHEAWLHSDIGHQLLQQVMAGEEPRAPGHPSSPCRARHCVHRVTATTTS
jgi:hypothetical protein